MLRPWKRQFCEVSAVLTMYHSQDRVRRGGAVILPGPATSYSWVGFLRGGSRESTGNGHKGERAMDFQQLQSTLQELVAVYGLRVVGALAIV